MSPSTPTLHREDVSPAAGTGAAAPGLRPSLTLMLIDDHPLWREGVSSVLRRLPLAARVDVLAAATGTQALDLLARHPDVAVVLLDLSMPQMDGMSTLQAIQRQAPQVAVMMLSASESVDDVRRCLAAGAMGYLPKATDEVQLTAAISMVLAGCVYVPPLVLGVAGPAAPQAVAGPPAVEPGADLRLTPRQLDVLRLLCDGQTNKQISVTLGLSEKTTKAHVGAIFRALGVVNRTQAALVARHHLQGPGGTAPA